MTPTVQPTASPMVAQAVTITPTALGTPHAVANVSDQSPPAGATVTVTGKLVDAHGAGIAGASMHANWNFRTTTLSCDGGSTDSSGVAACALDNIVATTGFPVRIDLVFTVNGATYNAQTSFTPQ